MRRSFSILDLAEKPPKRAEQLRDAEAQEMFEATMAEVGQRQRDPAMQESPVERR